MLKLLGRFLLALLVSMAIGVVVGTVVRMRLEQPEEYLGAHPVLEERIG